VLDTSSASRPRPPRQKLRGVPKDQPTPRRSARPLSQLEFPKELVPQPRTGRDRCANRTGQARSGHLPPPKRKQTVAIGGAGITSSASRRGHTRPNVRSGVNCDRSHCSRAPASGTASGDSVPSWPKPESAPSASGESPTLKHGLPVARDPVFPIFHWHITLRSATPRPRTPLDHASVAFELSRPRAHRLLGVQQTVEPHPSCDSHSKLRAPRRAGKETPRDVRAPARSSRRSDLPEPVRGR